MENAGGPESPIVVIPTAGSDDPEKNDPGFERLTDAYRKRGFNNVSVLHASSKEEANADTFVQKLRDAKGIWFTGGRQWRLMDAYFETASYEAFRKVLANGGIIAGTSAGATIQGSYLARGDSKTNTIMMGDHEEGFSLVTNIAIDQHVLRRNRQFDIFEILDAHPELLGIGLDENTGILVKSDHFEVVGKSYVLVYDGTFWHAESNSYKKAAPGERVFHLMKSGQKYHMANRIRME
jgi:cyanophycinase